MNTIEDYSFTIINDQGMEVKCDLISIINDNETHQTYVIYTDYLLTKANKFRVLISELVEKGMISRKKDSNGRSYNLKTTPKFAEYFKIKGNAEILSKVEMSKLSEILELNKQ